MNATLPRLQLRECVGKRPYDTARLANKAARFKTRHYPNPQRAYACSWCGRFHLTTDKFTAPNRRAV